MMGDDPGMMLPLLLRGVDLTPEQETQVQEIMAAHRATLRTLFGQLRAANEEIASKILTPGDVKEEELASKVQHAASIRGQIMQEGLKAMLEVRKVLTSEQLAKVNQLNGRIQTLRAEIRERMQALRAEMRGLFGKRRGAWDDF
jgi:Spy/CpxP family protein refolding chaperone